MRYVPRRSLPAILPLITILTLTATNTPAEAESADTYPRMWATTAPAYQPLPATAPVDANSVAIVRNIKRYGIKQYGVPARKLPSMSLNIHKYSNPLWIARNTDPSYDIRFNDCQKKGYTPDLFKKLKGVRIPNRAKPSAGTDGQLTVFNSDTGRYVDLWQAFKKKNKWYACWGGSIASTYQSNGTFPAPAGVSASGVALEPYTVKVAELRAGHIDHVIGMQVPPQTIDSYVSKPATRTDGRRKRAKNTISEGQYLRLPANLNIDSLNLHPVAKTIAKAAQKYGFMVVDGSGGINFSLENASTFAKDPYPKLFGDAESYSVMWGGTHHKYAAFPFDKLQVLKRDYVPKPKVAITVTDQGTDSFGFQATGAPSGARLVVTWSLKGQTRTTTAKTTTWWSGQQTGYRHAQARLVSADGTTLVKSPVVRSR
ncbi:MAG: hypothetical protein QM582_15785 [Micropruina sp.]|uniref:hypothetical protein n=1 Tax=Micropruina sp. TaxID=2737536 RepID=UPI0039E3F8F9